MCSKKADFLKNKTVFIIGANSDIAKTFVLNYIPNFKKAVLASRDINGLERFAKENKLCNCTLRQLDITDEKMTDGFLDENDTPDVIVFCAGHVKYSDNAEDLSFDNIEKTIRINFESAVQFLEKITAEMKKRQSGQVVVLSSVAGERGKASNRVYSAAKSGLTAYAEGLAQSCAGKNVYVSVIKLGHVNTKMLRNIDEKKQIFPCDTNCAAKVIYSSIIKNKSAVFYCRKIWRLIAFAIKIIPKKIFDNADF